MKTKGPGELNRTGAEMILKPFLSPAIYKPRNIVQIFFIVALFGSILFERLVVDTTQQAQ